MADDRHIYAVRAATAQEVHDHLRVRAAFLNEVLRDPRVGAFFAVWADQYRIDRLITALTPVLDRAATAAGFPSRAALRTRRDDDEATWGQRWIAAVPDADERVFLSRSMVAIDRLLHTSHRERWQAAQGFIVAVLYRADTDEAVPIRGWLAEDLVTMFDHLVADKLYGTTTTAIVTQPDRVPTPPSGRRGKRGGPRLEDYARWVYRVDVAEPRATLEMLVHERLQAMGNPAREPKDRRGVADRVDTKAIRYGLNRARRLLALTVPPERWTAYFDKFLRDRGGKISN
jgi:hypothetical protein